MSVHERKIFVGGLKGKAWNVTKIKDAFIPFGPIEEVTLGKETTAFIIFKFSQDSIEAIENMNGAEFENCYIRVEAAKSQGEFKSQMRDAVWGANVRQELLEEEIH